MSLGHMTNKYFGGTSPIQHVEIQRQINQMAYFLVRIGLLKNEDVLTVAMATHPSVHYVKNAKR